MSPKKGRSKLKRWAQTCCCLGGGNQDEASGDPGHIERVSEVQEAPEALSNTPNSQENQDATILPSNDERTMGTPSDDEAETHPTPRDELGLWGKALDRLEQLAEDSKPAKNALKFVDEMVQDPTRQLDSAQTSAKEIEGMMKKTMADKEAERGKGEWKFSIKGQEYSVGEFVDKAAAVLNKFAVLGDLAASIDPIHAALPWAAVRYVLLALGSDSELRSKTAFGIAKVSTLMFQCDLYQGLYTSAKLPLDEHQPVLSQLDESIVACYVQSLLFLGFAYQHRSRAAAPLKLHDAEGYIQGVVDAENNLVKSSENCGTYCNHLSQTNVVEILHLLRQSYQSTRNQEALLVDLSQYTALSSLKTAKGAAFNSFSQQNDPKCHQDTRVELLEKIETWARDPKERSVFWLQGMAGTGKSTISRTIVERFSRTGELGASFFFKRGESDRSSAEYLFTTICRQLCQQHHSFAQHIQNAICSDPSIGEAFTNEQFEKLILKPLVAIANNLKGHHRVVIVIDALDECDQENDVKRIISLLSTTNAQTAIDIKFFLTSRPELHIQMGFKDIGDKSHQKAILHEIPKDTVQKDISTYLTDELKRIRDKYNKHEEDEAMHISPDWPDRQSVETLVRMAVPLFIFAATICRLLEESTCSDPELELKQVLARPMATYDEKLNAAYRPVLERLVLRPTASQNTKKNIVERFQNIVGPIVILEEPLSRSSLKKLLKIDERIINDTLKPLRSVISVPLDAATPIRTFHLSFREFLVDENRCTIKELSIRKKETHATLAVKCLDLLSKGYLKENICGLDSPGKRRSNIDPEDIDKALPSEVQYACRYWTCHLRQGQVRFDETHQAYLFLQTHVLNWLEALSLIGRISESLGFIQELRELVHPGSSAEALIYDAKRFILQFRAVIDDTPLQLYSSALLFAPEHSVIRNLFRGHIDWITQKPMVEQDWNPCLQTLEITKLMIASAAFSSDGKLLATGSFKGEIRISDSTTGAPHQVLGVEGDEYMCSLTFSTDGKYIASGSCSGAVRVWDVVTGALQHDFRNHTQSYNSVVFSEDGKLVASTSRGQTLIIWNVDTGRLQTTLVGDGYWFKSIAFLGVTNLIASGSGDSSIKVWDITTGALKYTFECCGRFPDYIAFHKDMNAIVSTSVRGLVDVWDLATGTLRCTVDSGDRSYKSVVTISSDGKLVAFLSFENILEIWDVEKGTPRHKCHIGTGASSLVFSPDSSLIALPYRGLVGIWDATAQASPEIMDSHSTWMRAMAISADKNWVATASSDGMAKVWDTRNGMLKYTLESQIEYISSIIFSPDGKLIASISMGSYIIWDAVTGILQHTIDNHQDERWSPRSDFSTFSTDSKLLAFTSNLEEDGYAEAYIYDTAGGTLRHTFCSEPRESFSSIAFSVDSELLALGSNTGLIRIWDTTNGTLQHTLNTSHTDIPEIIFSADGKLIAAFCHDVGPEGIRVRPVIMVWDTSKYILTQSIHLHSPPNNMSFTADGSFLFMKPGYCRTNIDGTGHPTKSQIDAFDYETTALNVLDKSESQRMQILLPHGYSLNSDDTWINKDGRNVLWLPPNYRPDWRTPAKFLSEKTIVIGTQSRRVIVIGFES